MRHLRWSREAPQLGTSRAKAMVAGTYLTAGGIPGLYLLATVRSLSDTRVDVIALNGGLAILGGIFVLLLGHRLPDAVFHVLNVTGSGLVTVAVLCSPWPDLTVAFAGLYLFVAVDAFFLFPLPVAVRYLALVAVLGSVSLWLRPNVSSASIAMFLVILCSTSWVVRRLVVRASSASIDSLTGLTNAAGFADALEGAAAEATRAGTPLSVVLLDADNFHATNRARGQAAGDDLLRAIGRELAAALPRTALLSRQASDEFALLLPGLDTQAALALAESVRTTVKDAVGCSMSGGVSEHLPHDGGADLVRRAEAAVREAKNAGRDRCVVHVDTETGLARDLAAAIAADAVDVHFQPVVRVEDEQFVGVEALARWTHPVRGPISPAEFIPAAESAGIIIDLGAAVMGRACRDALLLRRAWERDIVLTVNVSGRELTEPGYAEAVGRVLASTGWPASLLVLEITESMVEGDFPVAISTMQQLRDLGVAIAIDDFGTGYSSFARLDTVPADYLKLDHSFIATITTSARRASVLQGVLALSDSLGLTVIAEGVEHPAQTELLNQLRCPLAQGYLFSRPQPVEVLMAAAASRAVPAQFRGSRDAAHS